MTSKKTWMQTTKWSTGSKIPDFQNGEKSPRNPNLESAKVGAKVKFLQFIYLWEKNVVKINIEFRTRVQKWTYCKIFSNEHPWPEPFYPTFRGCQRHCHQQ